MVFKGIYGPEINCAISQWRVGGLLAAARPLSALKFALIEAIRRQWTAGPLFSEPWLGLYLTLFQVYIKLIFSYNQVLLLNTPKLHKKG